MEATNSQYIFHDDIVMKKLFLNNVNSYQGSSIVRKILSQNVQSVAGNVIYEIYGTTGESKQECQEASGVILLNPNKDSFLDSVAECDIIIYDISQELVGARQFLKHFESKLKKLEIDKKKQIILVSTIMTWAQTKQTDGVVATDLSYRKRKPHPCYTNHLTLERDFMNLAKKYKEIIDSLVVCPGIIYGGKQDIFHFLYKKCYFNNTQLDIFAPGTNYLPLVYIEDFANIMMLLIRHFPDPIFPYILAVQPESMSAKNAIATFADGASPDTRVRVCDREEIFLVDEELMTVRNVIDRLTIVR